MGLECRVFDPLDDSHHIKLLLSIVAHAHRLSVWLLLMFSPLF